MQKGCLILTYPPWIYTPESLSPCRELSLLYSYSSGLGYEEEILDIVEREEESTSCLSYIHEVTEISERVPARYCSLVFWKHWDFILTELVFLASDLDISITRKCLTMSTNTCRKDTIEHIDTTSNPLNEILWRPNSHEVSWFFLGEYRCKDIKYSVHIFFGFTD